MPRRFRLFAVAGALLVIAGSAAVASASEDNHEQLCGRYQTTTVKGSRYVVQNNVWGATTKQCLDVGADGSFRVTGTTHRNVGTAAAFPSTYTGCHWGNCTRATALPVRVDTIRSARSSWRTSTGAAGIWNATYDIWFHTSMDVNRSPDGAEVMIWLDYATGANPGGTVVARNVRIADAEWDVWYLDSSWNYVAYVRSTRTSSTRNLDLRAFMADAATRGYLKPSWYLSGIEAGFEIWQGGMGLKSKSFSATVSHDPQPSSTPSSAGDGNTAPPPPAGTPAGPPAKATPSASSPPAAAGQRLCTVRWTYTTWETGLVADVVVVNHGPPRSGWKLEWTFPDDEQIDSSWGVEIDQDGRRVTAGNAPYNAVLGTGASETFGFQARHRGKPRRPGDIRLGGSPCRIE